MSVCGGVRECDPGASVWLGVESTCRNPTPPFGFMGLFWVRLHPLVRLRCLCHQDYSLTKKKRVVIILFVLL